MIKIKALPLLLFLVVSQIDAANSIQSRHHSKKTYPQFFKLPSVEGKLLSWNCADNNRNAICIATGFKTYHQNVKAKNSILFLKSYNGGQTWLEEQIHDLPPNFEWGPVSCTSEDVSFCMAPGLNLQTRIPSIAQSNDNGQTWSTHELDNQHFVYSERPSSFSSCCANLKNSSLCIATATQEDSTVQLTGVATQTMNKGSSWSVPGETGPIRLGGKLYNAQCSILGDQIHASIDGSLWDPFEGVYQKYTLETLDGGINWG